MKTARACTLALVATLTAAQLATPQQKPPAQPTPAQLQQQIDDLKKHLDETQQTAATAKLANDYAQKTEDDAKSYYEKVLSTQTNMAWIVGISISVFIAIAGLLNFGAFQKLTNKSISDTAAKLRNEYSAALATEIQKLKEANATNMQALSENLTTQMKTYDNQVQARLEFAIGLLGAGTLIQQSGQPAAVAMCRTAIGIYKHYKGTGAIEPSLGIGAISLMISFILRGNPNDFPQQVRDELAANHALFVGLDQELTRALAVFPQLSPVVVEWLNGSLKPSDQPPTEEPTPPPANPTSS